MRLTIYTSLIGFAFLFAGCSTTSSHKADLAEHHHHHMACKGDKCERKTKDCDKADCKMEGCQMYEKHCAYSVSQGELNVTGKDDYMLKHKGHTYYFSSKEKMNKFKEKLEENIEKADQTWLNSRGGKVLR